MVRRASELRDRPKIVVTNPDEDTSPEVQRELLDELLAGPEPDVDSVNAADSIRVLRDEAEG